MDDVGAGVVELADPVGQQAADTEQFFEAVEDLATLTGSVTDLKKNLERSGQVDYRHALLVVRLDPEAAPVPEHRQEEAIEHLAAIGPGPVAVVE